MWYHWKSGSRCESCCSKTLFYWKFHSTWQFFWTYPSILFLGVSGCFLICLFIFSLPSQTQERKNKMQEKASSPKRKVANMTQWSLKGWKAQRYVNGKQNMYFLLQDVMPGMFQMTAFDKGTAKLLSLHRSHHTVGETRVDKNKHVFSFNVSNQVTKLFFCHGSGVQTLWCVLLFVQLLVSPALAEHPPLGWRLWKAGETVRTPLNCIFCCFSVQHMYLVNYLGSSLLLFTYL